MKIINIDVIDKIDLKNIKDTESELVSFLNSGLSIPASNYNNILLNFNFISPDATEEGLHLFAIFSADFLKKPIEVEITEIEVDGEFYKTACLIPVETLQKKGNVTLGVYGYVLNNDDTLNKRISLNPIVYTVNTGSYSEDAVEGIIPTPTAFEVYFNKVANMANVYAEKKQVSKQLNDLNNTLQANIDSETIARENATNGLQTNIDAETTIRKSSDSNLQSQINSLASGSPLVASSISEMTDTNRVYVNTTDGNWYYYNGSAWVVGGVYQAPEDSETVEYLKKIVENYSVKTVCGNLFNKDTITQGKYINGSSGYDYLENEIFGCSDFIDTLGENVIVSNVSTGNRIYFYDKDKVGLGFDSLLNYNSSGAPENTKYIRFNFGLSYLDNIFVCFTEEELNYHLDYGARKIEKKNIIEIETIENRIEDIENRTIKPIDVYVGSTRTIKSLVTAVETYKNQASKLTPINIYLDAGTYDVLTTEMLENADSSFVGLCLPDYMNIYGSGMNQTIITATVPEDISAYSVVRNEISTLNVWLNNIIKDVTISMTNGRYTLHNDDYKSNAVPKAIEIFENVRIVYEGITEGVSSTGLTMVPIGCGAYNGRITTFKNCIFEGIGGATKRSLLLHNATNSPLPCRWIFENCDFIGGYKGVGISSNGSGQVDEVIMKGCKLSKNIEFYPQTAYTNNGGTESEFVLRGYANEIPGYTWTNLTENTSKIRMI